MELAGADGQSVVFLLSDSQIAHEAFLEDINSLLNAGEVPGMFESEELDNIVLRVRPAVRAVGGQETRDNILRHFVTQVRLCSDAISPSLACCSVRSVNECCADARDPVSSCFCLRRRSAKSCTSC